MLILELPFPAIYPNAPLIKVMMKEINLVSIFVPVQKECNIFMIMMMKRNKHIKQAR